LRVATNPPEASKPAARAKPTKSQVRSYPSSVAIFEDVGGVLNFLLLVAFFLLSGFARLVAEVAKLLDAGVDLPQFYILGVVGGNDAGNEAFQVPCAC